MAYYWVHASNGFVIVSIEVGEPRQTVLDFVEQYHMTFLVWLDPNKRSLDAFKNQNLANSYVIDRTGTVRVTSVGEINREILEEFVPPLTQRRIMGYKPT